MKFITRFLIPVCTLLAGLMCGACSDDDKQIEDLPEAPYLTVSETVFGDVGVDDVTLYTTVASSRTVTVRSSDEWCEAELLADTEKENLRLTVMANPDEKERTATVTVSAPECESVAITVTQAARTPEPFLTVSVTEFPEVGSAGEKLAATVTTNQSGVRSRRAKNGARFLQPLVSKTPRADCRRQHRRAAHGDGYGERSGMRTEADRRHAAQKTRYGLRPADLRHHEIEESRADGDLAFTFDKNARTLKAMYLKWIEGANPEMMIPTFTHNGEKVLVDGVPVVSGETKISLAEDVELEVVAESGDRKVYTVTLNCPQINTELAVLHMQPPPRSSARRTTWTPGSSFSTRRPERPERDGGIRTRTARRSRCADAAIRRGGFRKSLSA